MDAWDYLRFVLALAFVLSLMGIFAQLAKRANWGKMAALNKGGKRLTVIEMRAIDTRHKLALVRCDEREYLLVLGPDGQSVLDAGLAEKEAA